MLWLSVDPFEMKLIRNETNDLFSTLYKIFSKSLKLLKHFFHYFKKCYYESYSKINQQIYLFRAMNSVEEKKSND